MWRRMQTWKMMRDPKKEEKHKEKEPHLFKA